MTTDGPTELDCPSDAPTQSSDDSQSVDRTMVSEGYDIRLPPFVREHLDLEPGDEVRWTLAENGVLAVERVDGEWGVFDDFEPVDMGETNSVEEHDLAGYEPAMSE